MKMLNMPLGGYVKWGCLHCMMQQKNSPAILHAGTENTLMWSPAVHGKRHSAGQAFQKKKSWFVYIKGSRSTSSSIQKNKDRKNHLLFLVSLHSLLSSRLVTTFSVTLPAFQQTTAYIDERMIPIESKIHKLCIYLPQNFIHVPSAINNP